MAQQTYRANLSAAIFPLLTRKQGRTVIHRQYDQNYVPNVASSESDDKGIGIPQAYYMHNVLPTKEGYASVGYTKRLQSVAGASDPAVDEFFVREGTRTAHFILTQAGKLYAYLTPNYAWVQIQLTLYHGVQIHKAVVGGKTYILFQYPNGIALNRCYTYNFDMFRFDEIGLVGLDMATIRGLTASNGYMIAWTKDAVAWSSTTDVTDFTPSLTTGAGGGSVEQAAGDIVTCTYTPVGFIVYTTGNVVAAVYQGNSRYPFQFRELVNSGGIEDRSQVAFEANTGVQYAFTTSGLQAVTVQKTEVVFPEITDFISGREFEDFQEDTNTFLRTLTGQLIRRIAVVADRYLVISYGTTTYTHALVVDTALRRMGKLKIPHIKCFEWVDDRGSGAESGQEQLAFLTAAGEVYKLSKLGTDLYSTGITSVILLGKYQFVRQRLMELHQVDVETTNIFTPDATFTCHAQVTHETGADSAFEAGYTAQSTATNKRFNFRSVGINISLLFKGAFELTSLVLSFTVHGGR